MNKAARGNLPLEDLETKAMSAIHRKLGDQWYTYFLVLQQKYGVKATQFVRWLTDHPDLIKKFIWFNEVRFDEFLMSVDEYRDRLTDPVERVNPSRTVIRMLRAMDTRPKRTVSQVRAEFAKRLREITSPGYEEYLRLALEFQEKGEWYAGESPEQWANDFTLRKKAIQGQGKDSRTGREDSPSSEEENPPCYTDHEQRGLRPLDVEGGDTGRAGDCQD